MNPKFGIFYLLLIQYNKPDELLKDFDFDYELLSKERFHNEEIYVYKLRKKIKNE